MPIKNPYFMEGELPSYWVGLHIPKTDCHITLAYCAECTPEKLKRLKKILTETISELLPLEFTFGAFQKRGTPPTIPAYNMFLADNTKRAKQIDEILQQFYTQFSKQPDGKEGYPRLEYHASCQTDEKRKQLEDMQANGDRVIITQMYLRQSGSDENLMHFYGADKAPNSLPNDWITTILKRLQMMDSK